METTKTMLGQTGRYRMNFYVSFISTILTLEVNMFNYIIWYD